MICVFYGAAQVLTSPHQSNQYFLMFLSISSLTILFPLAAINILKDATPGTFVVRDSHSFPGAFGLAVRVAYLPTNIQPKSSDMQAELVRHFLIEGTNKGVRLKGCSNEPVFGKKLKYA